MAEIPGTPCTVVLVHHHVAPIELEAGLGRPQAVGHRPAPRGHEQVVGPQGLDLPVGQLDVEIHAVGRGSCARHFRPGVGLDATFPEDLLQFRGDRLVLERHQPRQQLDDRHLTPEASEDRPELDAHRARAEHDDGLGDLAQANRLVTRDDPAPVDLHAGNAPWLGAGCDDDLFGGAQLLRLVARDIDGPGPDQTRRALDPVDLVLAEQELDTLGERRDDLVLASLHLAHVDTHRRPVD